MKYENMEVPPDVLAANEAAARKLNGAGNERHAVLFKLLAERATTFTKEFIERKPQPKPSVLGKYPAGYSSGICSGGGVGKTLIACLDAMRFGVIGGETLFVTAEDAEDDYQTKVHNMLLSPGIPVICTEPAEVAGKIHTLNLRGLGIKFVAESCGCFRPSPDALCVGEFIKSAFPNVGLIFFETVSRLAGGEDNEHMEAYVTATDAIAIITGAACVSIHHTGKAQTRDNVIDLYSGRGGSAFGDNTRSMTVLTKLSDEYRGKLPNAAIHDDITSGDAFEVQHIRYSYGPRLPPEYFVSRLGYCNGPTLEPVAVLATAEQQAKQAVRAHEAQQNAIASRITAVIKAKGGMVPYDYFDDGTQSLIGCKQKEGRKVIKQMLATGSLQEQSRKAASGQSTKWLALPNHQGPSDFGDGP